MKKTTLTILTLAGTAVPPLVGQAPDSRRAPAREWNQWLGPARDGLSPDTGLLAEWPDGGPRLRWKTTGLGESFSSVSFAGERLFTMGDTDGAARLFALSVTDGKILWSAKVGPAGGRRNPGPRSTPSTDGKLVFALGHDGSLLCADVAKGEERWRKHLADDFGGRMMSGWGYAESPLLDGDLLVCTPGGREGAVVALAKATGEVVWRCEEIQDPAAYCSLVPIELGGIRQYLLLTGRSVAGIAAEDGKVLWRAERRGKTAVCTTPVYHGGWVFVTSGYNVGCNAFKVTAADGAFEVEEAYAGRQLQSHHGGVILLRGHVYGLGRRSLKCIELTTGKVVWEDRSVGKGSIAYADGHLVVRSERGAGTLALVEATPEGYHEKGRFDPPARSEEPSWAYPVIFGGRLWVRDQSVLLCFDAKAD